MDRLVVDTTVEALDMRLFDYRLRNAAPLRFALAGNTLRLVDVRLAGEDTALELSGSANLRDERMAVRMKGDANLGILQGFVANIRALRARLAGSDARGQHARAAAHRHDDGPGRPHPPLRAAARAREHPRPDPFRLARASGWTI